MWTTSRERSGAYPNGAPGSGKAVQVEREGAQLEQVAELEAGRGLALVRACLRRPVGLTAPEQGRQLGQLRVV
ncbi:hypothetical protein ACWGQ5_44505 [Streptomyces sp. NPDC055722]